MILLELKVYSFAIYNILLLMASNKSESFCIESLIYFVFSNEIIMDTLFFYVKVNFNILKNIV